MIPGAGTGVGGLAVPPLRPGPGPGSGCASPGAGAELCMPRGQAVLPGSAERWQQRPWDGGRGDLRPQPRAPGPGPGGMSVPASRRLLPAGSHERDPRAGAKSISRS